MARGIIYDDVTDSAGNGLVGVLVTVKIAGTATNATLYDAKTAGNVIANPIATQARGILQVWADTGEYDLSVEAPGGTVERPGFNVFDADDISSIGVSEAAAAASALASSVSETNASDSADEVAALTASLIPTAASVVALPAAADFSDRIYYVDDVGIYKSNGTIWQRQYGADITPTVATLADLIALSPATYSGQTYQVVGIGDFTSDGSSWIPIDTIETLKMYAGVGDDSTNNQTPAVNWLATATYAALTEGTYQVDGNTITIATELSGFGGILKHIGDESGSNVTSFILNGGSIDGANIQGTGRSSLVDMRGSRDSIRNSNIINSATTAASGRGAFLNSTADYQSVMNSFLEGKKFSLLSQDAHTGKGLLVVGNFGVAPDGAPFNYNHPAKTLNGLIHCANYSELSVEDSGNVELGLAIAGTQGGVLGISYILNSGNDALHSEDGHRNIVFNGIVADACRGTGINSLATGQEQEVGSAIIYNAISMRGDGSNSTIGINSPKSADNPQINGTILTSIVAESFLTYGMQLGDAVYLADNISVTGAPIGLRAANECRQYGNVYTDAATLVNVAKRAVVGPVHSAEAPTVAIIANGAGATDAKGMIRGFSYEFAFAVSGGGAQIIEIPKLRLLPTGLMSAQVYLAFGGSGGARGMLTATITWDGANFTIVNPVENGTGYTSAVFANNNGVLSVNINSSTASSDDRAVVEVVGVYSAFDAISQWLTSTSYTSGDYAVNAGNEYKATSSAVSGGTAPTHTTGTVSDGGVDWLFLRAV